MEILVAHAGLDVLGSSGINGARRLRKIVQLSGAQRRHFDVAAWTRGDVAQQARHLTGTVPVRPAAHVIAKHTMV